LRHPFTRDGEVDHAAINRCVPAMCHHGCAGRLDVLGGPPLGPMEDDVPPRVIALHPGDRFLAVIDDITEAVDPSDAPFGEARLEAFLASSEPQGKDVCARHGGGQIL
jgi:hypothetical protein